MSGINDFVVKFATVNGSGSASANGIFAKTLFRMGIPVSPKNIFPSNIQGLPTWYEVRVSEAGYLARRDGIDLMVAMNPQSYKEDLAEIVPGGWLLYDSTLPRVWPRDDITVLGVPIAEMCAAQVDGPAPAPAVQEHGLRRRADGAARHRPRGSQDRGRPISSRARRSWSPPTWRPSRWAASTRAQNFDCPLPIRVRRGAGRQGQDHGIRQRCGGARRHLRRRHRVRLVSDHAVDVAGRGLSRSTPSACA